MSKPAPGPSWSVSPHLWGAQIGYDLWTDRWVPKDKIVVHYGGGANIAGSVDPDVSEQLKDERSVLQGWERYHLGKKWRGIAYNYAVGQSGTVYRLRGWNLNGAQYTSDDLDADGIPENNEGVAVVFILGGDQEPTTDAYRGFEELRRYLEGVCGPLYLTYHREVARTGGHNTLCPGDAHLIPYCESHRSSTTAPDPVAIVPLRRGDKNDAVILWKALLWSLGYGGRATMTFRGFGKGAEKRTRRFQRDYGLPVTGEVDAEGWDTATARLFL